MPFSSSREVARGSAGDVARVRPVKLGAITANQVVVVEGLAPRESVVVTGASLLADGEAVRVIP